MENADLLVEVDEVPLRGPEDLPGTVQQRTGGYGDGDGEDWASRLEPGADQDAAPQLEVPGGDLLCRCAAEPVDEAVVPLPGQVKGRQDQFFLPAGE